MGNILLILAAIVLGFIILYFVLKRRLLSLVSPREVLDTIRREVDELIVELNQTTERNITLIEDKLQTISDILAKADKKISILKREQASGDKSRKVLEEMMAKSAEISVEPTVDPRENILRLHRAGFSPGAISKKTGLPVAHVELIISIEGQAEVDEV